MVLAYSLWTEKERVKGKKLNTFLKIAGWVYIISVILANIISAADIYVNTPQNTDAWERLAHIYSPFRILEVFLFILPGIILLAIRDFRIKLQEKAIEDAKAALEDEKLTEEQMCENYCKNGQYCPCCKGK